MFDSMDMHMSSTLIILAVIGVALVVALLLLVRRLAARDGQDH